MKHLFLFIILLVLTGSTLGQQNYKAGFFPKASLTLNLPKTWEVNQTVENRNNFFTGQFDDAPNHRLEVERTDLTTIVGKEVGIDQEAGIGYMLRFRNGEIFHRFLQQYSLVNKYYRFRMGYRFRLDQTINPNDSWTFRFRFRAASEIPLQGTKLDYKEFYLKLSYEQVLYYNQGNFDYGARTLITPGYYLSNQHKFELGFNHRFSRVFVENRLDQQFWICASWYFKPKWFSN